MNIEKLSFIFHNNINGLETKHELLQIFLANNTIDFNI